MMLSVIAAGFWTTVACLLGLADLDLALAWGPFCLEMAWGFTIAATCCWISGWRSEHFRALRRAAKRATPRRRKRHPQRKARGGAVFGRLVAERIEQMQRRTR